MDSSVALTHHDPTDLAGADPENSEREGDQQKAQNCVDILG